MISTILESAFLAMLDIISTGMETESNTWKNKKQRTTHNYENNNQFFLLYYKAFVRAIHLGRKKSSPLFPL